MHARLCHLWTGRSLSTSAQLCSQAAHHQEIIAGIVVKLQHSSKSSRFLVPLFPHFPNTRSSVSSVLRQDRPILPIQHQMQTRQKLNTKKKMSVQPPLMTAAIFWQLESEQVVATCELWPSVAVATEETELIVCTACIIHHCLTPSLLVQ